MRRLFLSLAAAVTIVTGIPAPSSAAIGGMQMSATMHVSCFGCGPTGASMSGTATGVFDIGTLVAVPITATFNTFFDTTLCQVLGSGVGTYSWGQFSGIIDFTMIGGTVGFWMKLPDGTWVHHWGASMVTNPLGIPCGATNATVQVLTAGVTEELV